MDKLTRKELLKLLKKCSPRTRSTNIQEIEGPIAEDGVGYVKEHLSFLEPDLTVREVTVFSMRTCNCGKIISQKNNLTGMCQHPNCERFTCSECVRACTRCGRTFCSRHAAVYKDNDTYCSRCKWFKYLKIFFDIGNNRRKGDEDSHH